MSNGGIRAALRQLRNEGVLQTAIGDCELLNRFADTRDEVAFTALLERHVPMVLRVCQRILNHSEDAEDACQATFLILIRNATSIRNRRSVASWLYGVAVRTARHLRRKRELHIRVCAEREAAVGATNAADPSWREIQVLLDEEVLRLPEKYRAPLVLCYLEGLKRAAAARQLGLTLNRLRGRLDYGRALLRGRLIRKGVELPTLLLTALLVCETPAAMSTPLTTKATAFSLAQRLLTAGLVSARVLALTESMVHSMVMTKFTVRLVSLVLLISLSVGASVMMRPVPAAEPSVTISDSPAPAQEPPQRAVPAKLPEDELNPHDKLMQCLNKHYVLADGEVLKYFGPPLPEERKTIFQAWDVGIKSKEKIGVDLDGNMVLKWNKDHLKFDSVSFGAHGFGVGSLPRLLAGITEEVEGDDDLLRAVIPGPGDFVVRDGAVAAKVIANLEEILNKQMKMPVKMRFMEVERKFYLLSGTYRFTSVMPGTTENQIELYIKQLLPAGADWAPNPGIPAIPGRPGQKTPGAGFPEFVQRLSQFLGQHVELGKVEGLPERVTWRENYFLTPSTTDATKWGAEQPLPILLNVVEQTGLSLRVETRRLRVLLVERKK